MEERKGLDERRRDLGVLIKTARRRKFGTVQGALRAGDINRATWLRIEDGQPVREDRLSAAEKALGWPAGTAFQFLAEGVETTIELDHEGNIVRQGVTIHAGSAHGHISVSGSASGHAPDVDPLEIEDDAEAMQEFLRQRAYRKGQSVGRQQRDRQDADAMRGQDPGGMEPA